ncbi:MAG TPA: hypothetical protein VH142_27330 [Polyangiaceae bacterium]|jgi:ABC-type thiamine transport system ATPase subunit|nr:hypothetical protein [Polyangiaceae bacterium]
MSRLELKGTTGRALARTELVLDAGSHVVLAETSDGADELVALISGAIRPRRGVVLLDGEEPYRSEATRASLRSLREREALPFGRTVEVAMDRALSIRGSARSASDVLGDFGLSNWGKRPTASLSAEEARTVALALALGGEAAALLALFEPLATGLPSDRVATEIASRARAGAVVVSVTASVRDAVTLGGRALVMDRGRIVRDVALLADEWVPGSPLEVLVAVDDPRRLAAALAADTDVSATSFDVEIAPQEIVVRGADPSRLALSVQRAAVASGARITSMTRRIPTMAVVRAASDAVMRAAYERAYRASAALPAPARAAAPAPLLDLPAPPATNPPEGGAT